jgi:hypothetical protein
VTRRQYTLMDQSTLVYGSLIAFAGGLAAVSIRSLRIPMMNSLHPCSLSCGSITLVVLHAMSTTTSLGSGPSCPALIFVF